MAIVDKIKSDIQFRNKVIGGAVVFMLVMVMGIAGVLGMETKSQDEIQQEDTPPTAMGVVPVDTTRTVPKKSVIYNQMDYFQDDENKEIQIATDESIIGKSQEEIREMQKQEDDEIANYMRQRRQKIQETKEEPRYTPPAQTSSNRRYNPYASQNDWVENDITRQPQIEDYKTGREKAEEAKPSQASRQNIRIQKDDFESLSEAQKRRVILTTGQAQYKESEQISAMIVSSGMVKSGETITLALKEDAILSFEKIPKGTTIAGKVSFSDNRLNVNFSTMRLKNKIIKIDLVLYGLDGMEGLPVNSNIMAREIEDTGIDEAMSGVSTSGGKIDPISITEKILRSSRRKQEVKVDLGRDVMCILVNRKAI